MPIINSTPKIIRVRRTDAVDEVPPYALLNISVDKRSKSRKTLDIKIIATEGEQAFVVIGCGKPDSKYADHVRNDVVQDDNVSALKGKTYSGTDTEWHSILTRTLLHATLEDCALDASALEGLELVCSVPNTDILVLTWQRKKRTSTQILGTLTLDQTDDEQIDPFIWAGDAIVASDAIEDDLESFQKQFADEKAITEKLRQQLAELTTAKSQHEDALLSKFSELINSKKLKIRDQQRLLAGAKIDAHAANQVTSAEDRTESGTSAKKRPAQEELSDDDDESDAFEDTSMKDAAETPEPSVAGSDKESSDEKESTPPPIKKTIVRRAIGGKQKASTTSTLSSKSSKVDAGDGSSHKAAGQGPSDEASKASKASEHQPPPPRRDLPFQKRIATTSPQANKTKEVAPKETVADDDDSETEEEL